MRFRIASGLVNARALVRRFAIAFGDLPYELRSSAHEGRQRALHYRSALLGPLRPLRGSRFALRQPDAFISPGRQAVREADAYQGCAGESRAFTTALHETSNGVLARLSGFALGYPLASLGPRKLGGYGGNFLQMKTTQRKGDRKAVEESRAKRNGSGASFANHRR